MKKNKDSRLFIFFGIVVYLIMLVFFSKINPLVVYDADDWTYISDLRLPIPDPREWNPTKIFPETFMPLLSYFGVYVIMPITKNYCHSLTFAHALFSSLIITVYFLELALLFYRKKLASATTSIGYGALFMLLHFISVIHIGCENYLMLSTANLTCLYNYTLPAVINAALVMHFMSFGGVEKFFKNATLIHRIIIVICGYFAINSNLYSSVVLAAYVGAELLLRLIESIKSKRFNLKDYCCNYWISLFIIVSWLVTNFLEMRGGRAGLSQGDFIGNLLLVTSLTVESLLNLNTFVLIFGIVVFILWKKKRTETHKETVTKFILYAILTLVYLMLLCAVVNSGYIYRQEVMICFWFYVFLALIAIFNELLKVDRKYIRTLFILAGTIILLAIYPGKIFVNYNFSNLSYSQCEALMNDYVEQFKTAEKEGLSEFTLYVPTFEDESNWPFPEFFGERISNSLYKHGIVNNRIRVKELVPTKDMNTKYNISEEPFIMKFSAILLELIGQ